MAAAKKKRTKQQRTKPPTTLQGFVEPSARVFTDWSEARIQQAEIQAGGGDLRQAADFCDWLLTDDRVASTLWTRVQSLLGLDVTFEASGDKRRSSRAVKALDAGEDWWAAYPETELALMHMWGLLLGVAPTQQPWPANADHGGRWLAMPEFWHPRNLRQDQQTKQWFIRVAREGNALSSFEEVEIVPGQPEWMLHMPYGKNRPWAWGLWRPLSRMVLIKQLARGDWSRAGEKGAILALTIAMDAASNYIGENGRPKDGMRQLATDVYNRGRNAVAALPPGVDLKPIDIVTKAKDLYESPVKLIDDAVAVLIRGGNLGTLTQGGSLAAAEAQERTADLPRLRFDAQSLTTTVHDQSLVHWAELNYGDQNLAPWPVYPVDPPEDLKTKSETTEKALANVEKADQLGFEIDRKAFINEFNIEWLKPGAKPKPPEPPQNPPPQDPQQGGGQGGAPADPNAPPPQDQPPSPAAQKARSVDGDLAMRLASGASAKENRGLLEGQVYVDALIDHSVENAKEALRPTLEAILEELDAAEDFGDLRERLRRRYAELSPEALSDLVYRVTLLAEFAGRRSVTQDA